MASISDQPASTSGQPAPDGIVGLRERGEEIGIGHCYAVGRHGTGKPTSIDDICPRHRKQLDILCTLTGYTLGGMCAEDRRNLTLMGDAIKNLKELGEEMPADGYGHPDLVTIKGAIQRLVHHSTALANRKKQREEAMAAAAQEETQHDESEARHSDKENVPPPPTTPSANPRPTTSAPAEGQKGKAQPGTSTIGESDAAATMVGSEPAGPAEAPKIPVTWVDRMKAKVSAGVAKAKRVRNMMC